MRLWEQRLALKRLRQEGRTEVDEEAIFAAIDAMRGIAEHASAESKKARRQRERRPRLDVVAAQRRPVAPAAEPAPPLETRPAGKRWFTNVGEGTWAVRPLRTCVRT